MDGFVYAKREVKCFMGTEQIFWCTEIRVPCKLSRLSITGISETCVQMAVRWGYGSSKKSILAFGHLPNTNSKRGHPSPGLGMAVLVSVSLNIVSLIWFYSQIQPGWGQLSHWLVMQAGCGFFHKTHWNSFAMTDAIECICLLVHHW